MNMQNQKQSKLITTIWLILLIAIWEGSVSLFKIEPWILPKPSAIVQELIGMKDLLLPNTMQTLQEVIIGLFFAILLGTSIAIIMDVIPYFNKSIARYFANNSNCCTCTAIYYLVWIWDVAESNGRNTCLFLPNCA